LTRIPARVCICAILLVHVLLLVPISAWADGGLIAPYGYEIYELSQLALVLFDDTEGVETLILQAEFQGEVRDFAWLIPTPSPPDLGTVDGDLFRDLAYLTEPDTRDRTTGCGCDEGVRYAPAPTLFGNAVHVYDQRTVGIYRTLTVGADSADVLADSLGIWGYLHDGNRQEVEEALQFYIDKSWVFVGVRFDTTSDNYQIRGGYLFSVPDPIRLTFESDVPVYPMRISALSAEDPSEVLIYVAASHRTTFPGATTEYANRLSPAEYGNIRSIYPTAGALLPENCFLTRLCRSFRASEMTDDVFLERAPNDDEFRQIRYVGVPLTDMLFVAMVGGLALASGHVRRKRAFAGHNTRETLYGSIMRARCAGEPKARGKG
jgi:hypothetical protein